MSLIRKAFKRLPYPVDIIAQCVRWSLAYVLSLCKLCTYTTTNPTRQALFEYDRLVRGIYTLKYLRDPQLERNIRRFQSRIESYHQLRAAVANVGGKKELTGKMTLKQTSVTSIAADFQHQRVLQLGNPVAIAGTTGSGRQCQGH